MYVIKQNYWYIDQTIEQTDNYGLNMEHKHNRPLSSFSSVYISSAL